MKKKEGFDSKCMFCPLKNPQHAQISAQYSVQCVNTAALQKYSTEDQV